jgi:hypothetical protein
MVQRSVSLEGQDSFAQVSGDYNPLHIDPVVARRTLFGRPIVHGINLLLGALNQHLDRSARLAKLDVTFMSSVGVDEPMVSMVPRSSPNGLSVVIEARGTKAAVINVTFGDGGCPEEGRSGSPPRMACREWNVAELPDASGSLDLFFDKPGLDALFPGLTGKLPADQIAVILATTRLVGMQCPGLHSIYYQLSIDFDKTSTASSPTMTWRVSNFDERVNCVTVAFDAVAAGGTIRAFLRPQPQQQSSAAAIRSRVPPGAFAGHRPLVIGGSRGIGEVVAKILSAGGADVCLTYHLGSEDAARVVSDIESCGGKATAHRFDVLDPAEDLDRLVQERPPTHLYYFPTPPMNLGAKGRFCNDLFLSFCQYYVTGFMTCHGILRRLSGAKFEMFYPSHAFAPIPSNMGEFAAAKAAGEALCRYLMATDKNVTIQIGHLPRLPTDQTAAMLAGATVDTVGILLEMLLARNVG